MSREEITLRFLLKRLKQLNGAYGYDLWLPNLTSQNTLLWQCAVDILESEPPPHPTHGPAPAWGAP